MEKSHYFSVKCKGVVGFLILTTVFCNGQTGPTLAGHQIGETAQVFFSKATRDGMQGQLTVEFCNSYFGGKKKKTKPKPDYVTTDECPSVNAALEGRDATISTLYAGELRQFAGGYVTFHHEWVVRDNPDTGNRYKAIVEGIGCKVPADWQVTRPSVLSNEWCPKTDKFIQAVKSLL